MRRSVVFMVATLELGCRSGSILSHGLFVLQFIGM